MSSLILVVDDESDVEDLLRQQFRRDLRTGRFAMDFARSGDSALQHINDAASASRAPRNTGSPAFAGDDERYLPPTPRRLPQA
jgi:CheY-like chemotaxis protein